MRYAAAIPLGKYMEKMRTNDFCASSVLSHGRLILSASGASSLVTRWCYSVFSRSKAWVLRRFMDFSGKGKWKYFDRLLLCSS